MNRIMKIINTIKLKISDETNAEVEEPASDELAILFSIIYWWSFTATIF